MEIKECLMPGCGSSMSLWCDAEVKKLKIDKANLESENQSLHDQITKMENERLKIYNLAASAKVIISNIQAT